MLVAASQFRNSQMLLVVNITPTHDCRPLTSHAEASETSDSWQRQLVSSAGLVYAEEHEVMDWLSWAQLSTALLHASSSSVLVAVGATGVVMSFGR